MKLEQWEKKCNKNFFFSLGCKAKTFIRLIRLDAELTVDLEVMNQRKKKACLLVLSA